MIYFFLNFFLNPTNGIQRNSVNKLLKDHHFSFQCTKCGKCCYGPGNVYFSKKELIQIKKFLKLDNQQWNLLKKKIIYKNKNELYIHKTHNKCYFLNKKNQCSIYPVRPLQCRSFPFWPSFFSNKKELELLIKNCPGSQLIEKNYHKKIPIYTNDEIVFRCNLTIKKFNRNQKIHHIKELIKL